VKTKQKADKKRSREGGIHVCISAKVVVEHNILKRNTMSTDSKRGL
jgi:hypothetical protein